MTRFSILAILLIVVLGGVFALYSAQNADLDLGGTDTSTWNTLHSEQYGFSIKYPDGWTAAEYPDDRITPRFNIYPESNSVEKTATSTADRGMNPPYTHHSDAPNVSVFPEGVPTEGVFGQSQEKTSDYDERMTVRMSEATEYILEDGTPWGVYLKFANKPSMWNASGFAWARASIDNLTTRCEREGEVLPEGQCDAITGDTVVRNGDVNDEEWQTAQRILETLTFTETAEERGDVSDLIHLDVPTEGATVTSPLTVSGEARGQWYFEAQFSVLLTDWDGRIIAEVPATAQGEWMTENLVPFEAELSFESPYSAGDPDFRRRGSLILQKANPSGLAEHDAALEIPVFFAPPTEGE